MTNNEIDEILVNDKESFNNDKKRDEEAEIDFEEEEEEEIDFDHDEMYS